MLKYLGCFAAMIMGIVLVAIVCKKATEKMSGLLIELQIGFSAT